MLRESGRGVHQRRRHRSILAAAVVVASVLGIGVASGYASPLEHFSGSNRGSFINKKFCGDMKVRIDYSYDFTVIARESGPDRLPRYTVTSHGVETFTNLSTGKSVTAYSDSVTQDVRVTDNGDGTLTVLYQPAGGARYVGPDGKVVLIDSRLSRYEIVLDHGGTPSDPSDDTFISEQLVVDVAAHVNKDFCSVFRTATQ